MRLGCPASDDNPEEEQTTASAIILPTENARNLEAQLTETLEIDGNIHLFRIGHSVENLLSDHQNCGESVISTRGHSDSVWKTAKRHDCKFGSLKAWLPPLH